MIFPFEELQRCNGTIRVQRTLTDNVRIHALNGLAILSPNVTSKQRNHFLATLISYKRCNCIFLGTLIGTFEKVEHGFWTHFRPPRNKKWKNYRTDFRRKKLQAQYRLSVTCVLQSG
jgi:hypothetical protein